MTYDNVAQTTGKATSITFPHTVGNFPSRILIVHVGLKGASDTVTGVTYNGVAMTRIAQADYSGQLHDSLWYLLNPDTGANNVVVSLSETSNACIISVSYHSVHNTGSTAINSDQTSDTTIQVTPTTLYYKSWMAGGFHQRSTQTMTPDAGMNTRNTGSNPTMGSGSNAHTLTFCDWIMGAPGATGTYTVTLGDTADNCAATMEFCEMKTDFTV